jgi:hypothetical protein
VLDHLARAYTTKWDIVAVDDGYEHDEILSSQRPNPMTWMNMMSVCTKTRAATLSISGVWSYLDMEWSHPWFELCYNRARMSSLSVIIKRDESWPPPSSREENFQLLTGKTTKGDAEGPSIRCLDYRSETNFFSHSRTTPPQDGGIQYDWNALGHAVARLRILRLQFIILTDIAAFPPLTHLALVFCYFEGNQQDLFRWIAHAFPQLSHLELGPVPTSQSVDREKVTGLEGLLPRLSMLRIHGKLFFVVSALHAFSVPQERLTVSVSPDSMMGDIRGSNLRRRGQILDRILVIAPHAPASKRAFHIRPTTMGTPFGDRTGFNLSFQHMGSSGPRVMYTDYRDDICGYSSVFERFDTVHVHGTAARAFFVYAKESPLDALASIQHVVIEDGDGGLLELAAWLEARASAGTPVQTINFQECQGYVRVYGPIVGFAHKIISEHALFAVQADGIALY